MPPRRGKKSARAAAKDTIEVETSTSTKTRALELAWTFEMEVALFKAFQSAANNSNKGDNGWKKQV